LELGTGIVILPQRNLLVRVKQAVSLDVLSGGRLLFGIGAGYLERSERGGRTDEYLGAVTALWTQQAPAYRGRYVDFDHVDAHPRPVLSGGPADRSRRAQPRRFRSCGRPLSRLVRQRMDP
jgi:alkanesulfonate monooxygenase SsuD/methylene tetrahydromethanopterin reductase-like flavin-dependent oxidoreductase (luciferase family)